jgi:hypothetical protein
MATQPAGAARLTEELLAEIVRRLVAALAPRAIYLFGSHASGQPHATSVVDVLVVLPGDDFSTWDVAKRGYGALDGMKLPVEVHFTWQDRFDRFSGLHGNFEAEVRAKGKLLYAT